MTRFKRYIGMPTRSAVPSYLVLVLLFATSCAAPRAFERSPVVPAASGTVDVDHRKDGNYAIEVEVEHLAPPDALPVPHSVYLVWLIDGDGTDHNLGVLAIDRKLRGRLKTVTPYAPAEIRITAELDSEKLIPSGYVVLRVALN